MTNSAVAVPDSHKRPGLTRPDIVCAALALVRSEGIEAVTMRRLAEEIGVTPMALYHHVSCKKELLDLVVEQIGEGIRLPHDGRPWYYQMRDYAHGWREELHRHPGVAGYLLRQAVPPSMAWRVVDDAVRLLMEEGFAESQAARAFAALVSFVLARCDQEELMGRHGPSDEPWTRERVCELLPAAGDGLDPARIIGYLRELSADEHFDYTLECLLAGMEAERHSTSM